MNIYEEALSKYNYNFTDVEYDKVSCIFFELNKEYLIPILKRMARRAGYKSKSLIAKKHGYTYIKFSVFNEETLSCKNTIKEIESMMKEDYFDFELKPIEFTKEICLFCKRNNLQVIKVLKENTFKRFVILKKGEDQIETYKLLNY